MVVLVGLAVIAGWSILLGGLLMWLDRGAPEEPAYPRGVPGGEGEGGLPIGSFGGIPDNGGVPDFGPIPDGGPGWIVALFLLIVFGFWCYRFLCWCYHLARSRTA